MSSTFSSGIAWRDWSPDEEALLISLIESGMDFADAAEHLPGRTGESCRGHYYPRLHWHKLLNDDGKVEDDFGKESVNEVQDELMQDLEQDIGDELMREFERDIENPFLPDFECELQDVLTEKPKDVHPKPGASFSSVQSGSQRTTPNNSLWTVENNALLAKLKGAGIQYEDVSKQLPENSPIACQSQSCRLTMTKKR